jgi:two-component system chemotaxis sensor kinase CheA
MNTSKSAGLSIPQLRNIIITCLVIGVAGYTAVMFMLSERIANRFGPQVRTDLDWRVQRGAQELARSADVGLVLGDEKVVREAFGVYAKSADVQAIVAVDGSDKVVAQHGSVPEPAKQLFSGKRGEIRATDAYLVSWAPAEIEGAPVGKVAVVVSTKRLTDARALLTQSSNTTLLGGAAALLLGIVVVVFFTRAVAQRDAQLSDYAANLERKVDERTRELDERNQGMRLVLDNVDQGFVTVNVADGMLASERSAAFDEWFGAAPPGITLSAHLKKIAPEYAEWFDLGLSQLRDGFMPAALLLDQMPKRFNAGDRTYDVVYSPIGDPDAPDRLLVITSDVTEKLAHERAESEQRELVAFFQRVSVDRTGVEEFVTEAAQLVGALRTEQNPVIQKRLVHTLKGNTAIYALASISELAHQVESDLADTGQPLSDEQRDALVGAWKQAVQRVGWLLASARRDTVEVDRIELDNLVSSLKQGAPANDINDTLNDWLREPVHRRLERLGRQACALARRLHKPEPQIVIDAHGVRLDAGPWSSFWSSMVHIIRNAVDHGLETPQQRALVGKREAGTLWLTAERKAGQIWISLRDDGGGIDWERIRAKANAAKLPSATEKDLVEALFTDGVSTRENVTDTSGRGVGLSAIKQAVRDLGGRIDVESTLGKGTVFHFVFEERVAAAAKVPRTVHSSLMPALS